MCLSRWSKTAIMIVQNIFAGSEQRNFPRMLQILIRRPIFKTVPDIFRRDLFRFIKHNVWETGGHKRAQLLTWRVIRRIFDRADMKSVRVTTWSSAFFELSLHSCANYLSFASHYCEYSFVLLTCSAGRELLFPESNQHKYKKKMHPIIWSIYSIINTTRNQCLRTGDFPERARSTGGSHDDSRVCWCCKNKN
jgi:hypothetical protein